MANDKHHFKIIENFKLGELATFVPNKKIPRYDWFYYKEGFARDLVFLLIDEFGLNEGNLVLDPFNGSGTTILACKEKGIDAIGIDVSQLAVFASNVKCADHEIDKMKEAAKKLLKAKFRKPDTGWVKLDIVRRAFSKYALEDIVFFKEYIETMDEEKKIKDFLKLALINASTKCTYAMKSGGSIRIDKKRHMPPFRIMLKKVLWNMIKDVEASKLHNSNAEALFGDARKLTSIQDNTIDAIITSPPYLNKIEYTNVYAIETYLFFDRNMGKPAIRSFIGDVAEAEDVFNGKYKLPVEAHPYFRDMKKALEEMFRVLKPKGKAAIVVGNGCFPDGVVESDILLAEIAEQIGFKVDRIEVVRKIWCMKNRTEKVGLMNESIILLEK